MNKAFAVCCALKNNKQLFFAFVSKVFYILELMTVMTDE